MARICGFPVLEIREQAELLATATRGVDNRNNVERVPIAAPAPAQYRITVTHSGGLPGNPAPSGQAPWLVLGGAVPEAPRITLGQYRFFSMSRRFASPFISILLGLLHANLSHTLNLPRSIPQTRVMRKMGWPDAYERADGRSF